MPFAVRLLIMVAALFLQLFAPTARGDDDEEALDLRAAYPLCPAWSPYSQGTCSSCCAAAVATVVAAHECLEHGRASRYSMTQIWDCVSDGTCSRGGSLVALFDAIAQDAAHAFVPADCAPLAPHRDSNLTQCHARLATTCAPPQRRPLTLESSLFFDLAHFAGPRPDVDLAARALMHELQTRGPVIAVLRLVGQINIAAFRTHNGAAVFAPLKEDNCNDNNNADDAECVPLRHCLVVYGWGVALEWDPATAAQRAVPFWRVLNSYGSGWGINGTARILRGTGLLEAQWRSLRMAPHPCPAQKNEDSECGRLPYANYSLQKGAEKTPASADDEKTKARPDNWSIIALACGVVVISTGIAGLCLYRAPPPPRHAYYHPFSLTA